MFLTISINRYTKQLDLVVALERVGIEPILPCDLVASNHPVHRVEELSHLNNTRTHARMHTHAREVDERVYLFSCGNMHSMAQTAGQGTDRGSARTTSVER